MSLYCRGLRSVSHSSDILRTYVSYVIYLLTYILGGQKAVTVEQSGLSAAQSPRKFRKQPWRHFENDDTEAPDQSTKKQKTKDTEPKATQPKATTLKAKKLKPTNPEAEAVPHRKVTLRKSLGVSKEEALKLAKYHMSIATKLMEDSDEE